MLHQNCISIKWSQKGFFGKVTIATVLIIKCCVCTCVSVHLAFFCFSIMLFCSLFILVFLFVVFWCCFDFSCLFLVLCLFIVGGFGGFFCCCFVLLFCVVVLLFFICMYVCCVLLFVYFVVVFLHTYFHLAIIKHSFIHWYIFRTIYINPLHCLYANCHCCVSRYITAYCFVLLLLPSEQII